MSYVIAIPSYKRSMVLLYRTLNFLERNSIDKKLIHIFIVEDDQEDYSQIPTYLYNKMVVGVKGLGPQRHFIENYFDECTYVVSIDDDIQDLIFAKPEEEIPLHEFFNNAFDLCKKENMIGVKGHRSVGGFRISLYNALPFESVVAFTDLMKEFANRKG